MTDYETVFERFREFLDEDAEIVLGEPDPDAVCVFEWTTLEDEDRDTIFEHHLGEDVEEEVVNERYVPFAIVGVFGQATSFESDDARYTLLFDLEAGDGSDCPVLAYSAERGCLETLARCLPACAGADLSIQLP